MTRLLSTNINTPEYWNTVYSDEIINSKERLALDRFQRVAAMIPLNSAVLDVGCGTGDFVRFLEKNRPDCNISACDFSNIAIEYAKSKSPQHEFKIIDILQLSTIYKKEFDFVLCFETIEHIESPQTLINEMQKVTKIGGTIVITTPYNNNVHGGDEHIHSFKYIDFLNFFDDNICPIIAMCRYSENYKNLLCVAKII